jgi:hypothetical protein
MLFEVVKGNSMGDVDNFTGVLNRLAGSEAISMISVRLSYMYKHTLEARTRDSLKKLLKLLCLDANKINQSLILQLKLF